MKERERERENQIYGDSLRVQGHFPRETRIAGGNLSIGEGRLKKHYVTLA